MEKKEIVSTALIFGIIVTVSCIGIASHFMFGNDNAAEEVSEAVAEDLIENSLELPNDSIHLDFSPGKEN